MMSVSVDAFVAGPRGHACHGVGDLRGDCGAPANLHRRLRRPERDPQGRVLEDARQRDMGGSSIARGDLADEIATLGHQPGGRSSPGAAPASHSRFRGPESSTSTFSSFSP